MWHYVAGDIDPHVTGKSIFRKHCPVKLRERHTGAFNSLAYDRWTHSDASRPKPRCRKSMGLSISPYRNCTRHDNRGFKNEKSRLFRREVILIIMRVNVRPFAWILFQKFKRSFSDNVCHNNNAAMKRQTWLLLTGFTCIRNFLNSSNDITYLIHQVAGDSYALFCFKSL